MIFNSYIFIFLFLPVEIIVYYLFRNFKYFSLAKISLLISSLVFCFSFSYYHCIFLILSILINYGIYRLLLKNSNKLFLILGIFYNILVLCFFKYTNFFITNINSIFKTNFNFLHLILPLGISFYTFSQISFLIDTYRCECPKYNLLDFSVFIAFFPKLIQGPIVYHHELIPQIQNKEVNINWKNISEGLFLFSMGLLKKNLIADSLGAAVDWGFNNLHSLDSITAFLVILSYTLQIYLDFSGYCDIAEGISRLFNMTLPANFNSPYKALNISDFWKRWHITLTRFFTKYLYIPLGGNRKGVFRTYFNVMIIFIVSGFWHGSGWNFIIWGFLHGLLSIIYKKNSKRIDSFSPVTNWLLTFSLINFSWIIFRAPDLQSVKSLLAALLSLNFSGIAPGFIENSFSLINVPYFPYQIMVIILILLIFICIQCKNSNELIKDYNPSVLNCLLFAFIIFASLFLNTTVSSFIYVFF